MTAFLVSVAALALLFLATCDSVDWTDFRAGENVRLPTTKEEAINGNWKVVEEDSSLQVSWYCQDKDPRFLIAFDRRDKCAGVKGVFLQSDIDEAHLGLYKESEIFEEGTYLGQKVFFSTVIFTDERVLKKGGRRMLPTDEMALGVYLKRLGKFRRIERDACEQAKNPSYHEQGCDDGYGLVFAKFGKKSSCESLVPFYLIFDPEETGNLLAFGWLSLSKFSKEDYKTPTFYQKLDEDMFKTLFPRAPDCLTAYASKDLTSLDVWLSYRDAQKVSCQKGKWVENHCRTKREKRPGADKKKDKGSDESSSESSDSSDGSSPSKGN